jgi:hypothetical protein
MADLRALSDKDLDALIEKTARVPVATTATKPPAAMTDAELDAAIAASAAPKAGSGVVMNAGAGLNDAIAGIAGAPVDAVTWLANHGPSHWFEGGPAPIQNPIGGSESIKDLMGTIGADPRNVATVTPAEQATRAAGNAAASMVLPEAMIGGLTKVGALPAGAQEAVAPYIGRTTTGVDAVKNLATGAAAGAAGNLASQNVPEPWKTSADIGGQLVGGGLASIAMEAPRILSALGKAGLDYIAPMTRGGQERAATKIVRSRAASSDLPERIAASEPTLPGSRPTTFQATGDMGLGSLEREVATRNPADFQIRRGEQNQARVTALRGVQADGAPEAVAKTLRQQMSTIEADTSAAVAKAVDEARTAATSLGGDRPPESYGVDLRRAAQPRVDAADAASRRTMDNMGGNLTPEVYGETLRAATVAAREAERQRMQQLWDAVEADGPMGLAPTAMKNVATSISKLPKSAKPVAGEERAIVDVIKRYGNNVPLREVGALRSRISDAMRTEMDTNGRSQVWGRLSMLRKSVEKSIDDAIQGRVATQNAEVAAGTRAPENTLAQSLQASADEWMRRGREAGQNSRTDTATVGAVGTAYAPSALGADVSTGKVSGSAGRTIGLSGDAAPITPEAADRLRLATSEYRQFKQTFDQGPAGDITRNKGMASEYRIPEGKVPSRIFHSGPTGFEDVQSFRRAVGDQESLRVLQDYAVSDLRRSVERPDGSIDPARFQAWRSKYQDALRAFPQLDRQLGTAEQAARAVEAARVVPRDIPDSMVPARIFHPGPSGYEDVEAFRAAVGDRAAFDTLQDYVASEVRRAAARPDGTIDPDKFRAWRARHRDALRSMPELDRRFASAASATEAVDQVSLLRKQTMESAQEGALGRILKVESPEDVTRTIGGIFGRADSVQEMKRLAADVRSDPEAVQGLRRAVVNHMTERFIGNSEVGTSGVDALRSDQFQTFLKKNRAALGEVFNTHELSTLDMIAKDLKQANRSVTAVRLPGQSNTAQDLTSVAAADQTSPVWMKVMASTGTGAAGMISAGPEVGLVASVGTAAAMALRDAGLTKVDAIVKQMMLDPEFARAMLIRYPAKLSRKQSITLGQRIRRLAVIGPAASYAERQRRKRAAQ